AWSHCGRQNQRTGIEQGRSFILPEQPRAPSHTDASHRWARKTFGFSILYLFMLFSALMLDRWIALPLPW
ncbi:MAG: hypothetical protein EBV03_09540, partial [Proteobacteria bacterium]|nr:hypothetical protein [Pseudomonadota bacterium]